MKNKVKKTLFLLLLALSLNVYSAPAPAYLVFTDYSVNNFDIDLCDLRGNLWNCTRYDAAESIFINTNRDWYIKIVPQDTNFIDILFEKSNYNNMRVVFFVCLILITVSVLIFRKK